MTIVIVSILLLGCLLIATENITKVNRAAVAIFAGTVGWVLYICFGMDFVTSQHAYDFFELSAQSDSCHPRIQRNSQELYFPFCLPAICGKSCRDSLVPVGYDDDC